MIQMMLNLFSSKSCELKNFVWDFILRLLFLYILQLCDPCLKAVKLKKVEMEEEQATPPNTNAQASNPIPHTNGCFLIPLKTFFII